MINGIMTMLHWFLLMILFVVKVLLILFGPVIAVIIAFVIEQYRHGNKLRRSNSKYKKPGILRRIYFDFPRQFAYDLTHGDPDEFKEYGLHIFCGEQGSGKTISVMHLIDKLRHMYPNLRVRSNIECKLADAKIETWQELVENDNGIYGQVEFIDEIQTWFSSMQSRDFPPEMLGEISQQRKQRKMLVGTAQVFGKISKAIREQTTFVYLPMTFMGCLTIVRVSKPIYYDDEKIRFKKYLKTYFFVHDLNLRNAYDTYEKVRKYIETGFQSRQSQLKND